ncbi:MAG TPA: hypothetical protein VFH77_01660 [Streptomyces sp.]|nr:hypothetical protein [Streptomyces sp.]
MSGLLHVCRGCDGLITEETGGVLVAYEPGNSGPGWELWAHPEHAHLVKPDPVPDEILARVRAWKVRQS